MTLTPEQPYSYSDPQANTLTLRTAIDLSNHAYVWLEAESLGGRTVSVASVWLRPDQAAALGRRLADATRYETTDHTGDRLMVHCGAETVVQVTRQPVAGEPSARVRVLIPRDRLPEMRTALAATSERAQQRATADARQNGACPPGCIACATDESHDPTWARPDGAQQ